MNPALSIILSTCELEAWLHWQGKCWDIVMDFDTNPQAVTGGYICRLCPPEYRKIFLSREAVWIDDIFEPFLEWVNTKLIQHSG